MLGAQYTACVGWGGAEKETREKWTTPMSELAYLDGAVDVAPHGAQVPAEPLPRPRHPERLEPAYAVRAFADDTPMSVVPAHEGREDKMREMSRDRARWM